MPTNAIPTQPTTASANDPKTITAIADKEKTDIKTVAPISHLELVDTKKVLQKAQKHSLDYEISPEAEPRDAKDIQPGVKTDALNVGAVSVIRDTGKGSNIKKPNQDAADGFLFDLPDSSPKAVMDAVKKSVEETADVLKTKYLHSGTTFTACALVNFSGRLVATFAQLGDSGACVVKAKDDKNTAQLVTPSHNLGDKDEVDRIIAEGHMHRLINIDNRLYLSNGYNFHQLKALPNTYVNYANSFIFIEDEKKLYHVDANQKCTPITINDIASFITALENIYNDYNDQTNKSTVVLKLTYSQHFENYFWQLSETNDLTPYALHVSGTTIRSLLQYCDYPEFSQIPDDSVRLNLGNGRCLGNGAVASCGMSYEPECTQLEINPADTLVLFTDGVTAALTLTQIAQFSKTSSIRKEAFSHGSNDDITIVMAKMLEKLLPGKLLLLIVADGHGDDGEKVSQAAIEIFKLNFCKKLNIKLEDVHVVVVNPSVATLLQNNFTKTTAPTKDVLITPKEGVAGMAAAPTQENAISSATLKVG